MGQETIRDLQVTIDYIEAHLSEPICLAELARQAHLSPGYFSRVFHHCMGCGAMAYVTRRRLQYALWDICRDKTDHVIDAAISYGFWTHAGFCRAFRREFGCSPTQYRLHILGTLPPKPNLLITGRKEGIDLKVALIEMKPRRIAGLVSRHTLPQVQGTRNIPVFWEKLGRDAARELTELYRHFARSPHGEYSVCFDVDADTGVFSYLLGVETEGEDIGPYTALELPGGVYAVFTIPWVLETEYVDTIRELWEEIFINWLPNSPYMLDEGRYEFEYYDSRDHAWEHGGKQQMDIYLPVLLREEQ